MKKILTIGLFSGFAMLLAAIILNFIFSKTMPVLSQEYHNFNLMRSFGDPIMHLFYLQPFILAIILSFVWAKINECIKGGNFIFKGVNFAFFYILIVVPGMIMTYATFQVSLLMVATWFISIIIQALILGIINAKWNN